MRTKLHRTLQLKFWSGAIFVCMLVDCRNLNVTTDTELCVQQVMTFTSRLPGYATSIHAKIAPSQYLGCSSGSNSFCNSVICAKHSPNSKKGLVIWMLSLPFKLALPFSFHVQNRWFKSQGQRPATGPPFQLFLLCFHWVWISRLCNFLHRWCGYCVSVKKFWGL